MPAQRHVLVIHSSCCMEPLGVVCMRQCTIDALRVSRPVTPEQRCKAVAAIGCVMRLLNRSQIACCSYV